MKLPAGIVFAAVFLAAAWTSVHAGNLSSVDSTGTVHSVAVDTWDNLNKTGGTVLIHTRQLRDGSKNSQSVPGTDDFALELDPFIDIDPVADMPVLVWARSEGNGTILQISRFGDTGWSPPVTVWSGPGNNLEPEIDVRPQMVHLVWMNDSGSFPRRYRLSLDRTSLEPVFGPEQLPINDPDIIPPEGQSADFGGSAAPTPDPGLSYFSSILPSQVPGNSGALFTWGIRDEPVPVVYFEALQIPAGIQQVRERKSEWISGRFVTWFSAGSSFYYTTLRNGYWDDLRIIAMDENMPRAKALRMLEDQIRRESEAP